MLTQPVSLHVDGTGFGSMDGAEAGGYGRALEVMSRITAERVPTGEEADVSLGAYVEARRALVDGLRAWPASAKRPPFRAELRAVICAALRGGWSAAAAAAWPTACAAGPEREADASPAPRPPPAAGRRWGELELAILLLAGPAWSSADVPAFADVADDWWEAYALWRFAPPQVFAAPGEAARHATHQAAALVELARWVERNPGSATVRAAAEACIEILDTRWLHGSAAAVRAALRARGRVLARLRGGRPGDHAVLALPREGRRLRVGVVAEHYAAGDATRRLLPLFGKLDPRRFEVRLHALREVGDALEARCRRPAAGFEVLPAGLSDRLARLRAAELDVLLFGADLASGADGVAELALHRIAPLQVAAACFVPEGCGLPEVDLLLAGESELARDPALAADLSERLGLLPGPALARDEDPAPETATQEWSRDLLGLAPGAPLLVCAADHRSITPETWELWAGLLAERPEASLLLHPFREGVDAARAACLLRQCQEVFGRHDIDPDRVIFSTLELGNRADLRLLLSIGDLYLDSVPGGDAEGALLALQAGLPVVTLGAGAGALLRSLGADELVAADADAYRTLARRLATEPEERARQVAGLRKALERLPLCHDPLTRADAVGEVLERAFDEVLADGARIFRERREPILATGAPCEGAACRARGLELLAAGRPARAVDYLLAALQKDDGTADLWLEVARALSANGQKAEAVQALESALRLDEGLAPGWEMLARLADEIGLADLAVQAREVVAGLAAASVASAPAPQGLRLRLGGKLDRFRAAS